MQFLVTHQEKLEDEERMLVIDIGGRVSSMTEVEVFKHRGQWELDIKYDEPGRSTVFYMGLLTIYEALERELLNLHPDLVKPLLPLRNHRDIVNTIIRTKGKFPMYGGKEMVDVSHAYNNAIAPFESEFLRNYSIVGNGTRNNRIVLSGGGPLALSQFLGEDDQYENGDPDNWLQHPYIFTADIPSRLQQANARGGALIFEEDLIRRGLIKGR